jgi:hypothetical protein
MNRAIAGLLLVSILASGCIDSPTTIDSWVGAIHAPNGPTPERFGAKAEVTLADDSGVISRAKDGNFPLYQILYDNKLDTLVGLGTAEGQRANRLELRILVDAGAPFNQRSWTYSWPINYSHNYSKDPEGGMKPDALFFDLNLQNGTLIAEFYDSWKDEAGASSGYAYDAMSLRNRNRPRPDGS